MGADDLIANGCEVAIMENHNGDPFANTYSNARNTYYNITGFPTAYFDGVLNYVGGSHTTSMYSNYLPLYNQRIAIPSDFTVEIYGDNTGTTYNILLVVTKVNGSWGNLKVHLALTESEIVYAWQGMSELNFVNRLMVPDQNGTTVNFTSATTAEVELTFTLESAWNVNHCELVAWVQNDPTKECLQGAKVELTELEPLQATAAFSCSSTTPCVNSTVEFEDQSGGEIISWNWTFEGGNPPTSTSQNPEVAYNAVGDYDVRLIVYDGVVYDTMLNQNYIYVITAPVQANAPWGDNVLCEGNAPVTYYTNTVPWALTYLWSVDPPAAGTITGPDTNATFTLNPAFLGNFQVKVRAVNNCGDGPWSSGFQCSVNHTPDQYTLSDGAGYCEGGQGIELILDGSETGVDYELYLDNVATGTILPGTGTSLNFGYQTEAGIYTCQAFTDFCDSWMVGNSYIYVISMPATAAAPTGSTSECNGHTAVQYQTTGAASATSYVWTLSPANAGTIAGTGLTATVDWDNAFTGNAGITVQGVNSCGSGPVSSQLQVAVAASPQPVVSGEPEVCDYDQGVIYSTPSNAGNTYDWNVTGGTISAGAGTSEIQVNWGAAGTGTVAVTESNANGCEQASEAFTVNIDDCTGVGENSAGTLRLYPNPARERLNVEFGISGQNSANITVINAFGQPVSHQAVKSASGLFQAQISLDVLQSGIYTLQVRTGDGSILQKKFVKSE
jgi:PKD repeat protein